MFLIRFVHLWLSGRLSPYHCKWNNLSSEAANPYSPNIFTMSWIMVKKYIRNRATGSCLVMRDTSLLQKKWKKWCFSFCFETTPWWNTPFEICHLQELLHIRSYTFHYVFKIPGSVKIKLCQILLQRITITSYLTVFNTNMGTTALTMVLIPVVWFLNPVSVIYYSKVIMQCKLDKVACTCNLLLRQNFRE